MDSERRKKKFTDFVQTFRDTYPVSTGEIPVFSVSFWQVVLELSIFELFCLNGFRTEKKKVHRFCSNFQRCIFSIYRGDSSLFGDFLTSSSWVMDFWTFLLEWIQTGEKKCSPIVFKLSGMHIPYLQGWFQFVRWVSDNQFLSYGFLNIFAWMDSDWWKKMFTDFAQTFRDVYLVSTTVNATCLAIFGCLEQELLIFEFAWMDSTLTLNNSSSTCRISIKDTYSDSWSKNEANKILGIGFRKAILVFLFFAWMDSPKKWHVWNCSQAKIYVIQTNRHN